MREIDNIYAGNVKLARQRDDRNSSFLAPFVLAFIFDEVSENLARFIQTVAHRFSISTSRSC